jgi:hypothetical protein
MMVGNGVLALVIAMRTDNLPLMALYLWRGGNLVQKSLFDAITS